MGKYCVECQEWRDIIGNIKDLNEIEQDCRKGLSLDPGYPFNLQACATAAGHLSAQNATKEGYDALQRILKTYLIRLPLI